MYNHKNLEGENLIVVNIFVFTFFIHVQSFEKKIIHNNKTPYVCPFIQLLFSQSLGVVSQAISHSTTGESKNARKGRRSQDLLQKHATSPHTSSLYTLTHKT